MQRNQNRMGRKLAHPTRLANVGTQLQQGFTVSSLRKHSRKGRLTAGTRSVTANWITASAGMTRCAMLLSVR